MSEWEGKSDFEINKTVAELMPPIISDNQAASLKSKSSSVLVNDIVSEWEFNPCNNPQDAWAIILENKISIEFRDSLRLNPLAKCSSKEFWHSHKNPLRAAMIVYLEMNGVEPNE